MLGVVFGGRNWETGFCWCGIIVVGLVCVSFETNQVADGPRGGLWDHAHGQ